MASPPITVHSAGMSSGISRGRWIKVLPEGLFVEPGGFFVDPTRAVDRAVISHGHSDHARPGHRHVLATAETLAIMGHRLGRGAGGTLQPLPYGEKIHIGSVTVWLVPAGHVLGSAQIVLEHAGQRVVVSGDYKRRLDPTCAPFEVVPCDVFITEATFGMPVFRHPPDDQEVAKLLRSLALFPERGHVVGAYALGKGQRMIALLRAAGYDRPIYAHGALLSLSGLYRDLGVDLGEVRPVTEEDALMGQVVLAPPTAMAERWARRLTDPVMVYASGWMRLRRRAKAAGVELPLVISDHADWDELCRTIQDVGAPEIWVTHGRPEALVHVARAWGLNARALASAVPGDDGREEGGR